MAEWLGGGRVIKQSTEAFKRQTETQAEKQRERKAGKRNKNYTGKIKERGERRG